MSKLPTDVLTSLLGVRFEGASLEVLLERYLRIAVRALPGVDDVSVTLLRDDRPFTAAHVGDLAPPADELQYERGYGPCIDAGLSGTVLTIDDMRQESRWPDYAAAVAGKGILSAVSVPLPLQTDLIGALNCYGRFPGIPKETIEAAVEISGHVAVAIGNAITYSDSATFAADMQVAMTSRAVIEQAKGAIMAQNRCGADEAFEILRKASMSRNIKLRDLAGDLVAGLRS